MQWPAKQHSNHGAAHRFAASGTYRLSLLVNKKLVTGARFGPITVYETESSTEVEDASDDCRQPISCSDHGTPSGCLCACDPGWTHSQDVSWATAGLP
jgi:hypothetical protein